MKTEIKTILTVDAGLDKATVYFTDGTRAATKKGHRVNSALRKDIYHAPNEVEISFERGEIVGVKKAPVKKSSGDSVDKATESA